MQIRQMTDADIPGVCELLRACYECLAEREHYTSDQLNYLLTERSSEDTVRREARTRLHLVACTPDRIVGVAVVNRNEVTRLYVLPTEHRKGIGTALFEAAEAIIRSNGFREVTVSSIAEGAVAFCRAMGMTFFCRKPWQPGIFSGRDVTMMKKTL